MGLVGTRFASRVPGCLLFGVNASDPVIVGTHAAPVDANTRFAIGSVTKQFACECILRLAGC